LLINYLLLSEMMKRESSADEDSWADESADPLEKEEFMKQARQYVEGLAKESNQSDVNTPRRCR